MVKEVLPTCSVCGAQVVDNVEPEIAKEGIIKQGKYVNNLWICNECLNKKWIYQRNLFLLLIKKQLKLEVLKYNQRQILLFFTNNI